MEADSDLRLEVSVGAFDGPFDLLLDLLRRHEYPIDNLPVVEITGEFLRYLRAAKEVDVDLGGEFLEAASWLVLLKSRSLLPREEATAAQAELRGAIERFEVDRDQLERTKALLQRLQTRREHVPASGAVRARGLFEEAKANETEEEIAEEDRSALEPDTATVLQIARRASERAHARDSISQIDARFRSVEEQKTWVREQLAEHPAGVAFSSCAWFDCQTETGSVGSLVMALLEFGRTGELQLNQRAEFGPIYVKTPGGNNGHQ